MIGYFTKEGDENVGKLFNPYLRNFNKIIKKKVKDKDYGSGLDLILIQYNLEGKYLEIPAKTYKVMPYRKNERSVSIVVGVPQSFKDLPDISKRQFIIDSTLESARLAQEKMTRLGFTEIDFGMLIHDIDGCAREFLGLKAIM